jgi:hypothetical protein
MAESAVLKKLTMLRQIFTKNAGDTFSMRRPITVSRPFEHTYRVKVSRGELREIAILTPCPSRKLAARIK